MRTDRGETVEIPIDQLNELDHDMSASMLEDIDAQSKSWLRVAQEHLREGRVDTARGLLQNAVNCALSFPTLSDVFTYRRYRRDSGFADIEKGRRQTDG